MSTFLFRNAIIVQINPCKKLIQLLIINSKYFMIVKLNIKCTASLSNPIYSSKHLSESYLMIWLVINKTVQSRESVLCFCLNINHIHKEIRFSGKHFFFELKAVELTGKCQLTCLWFFKTAVRLVVYMDVPSSSESMLLNYYILWIPLLNVLLMSFCTRL